METFDVNKSCFAVLTTEVTSNVNGKVLLAVLCISFVMNITLNILMIVGLRKTSKKLTVPKQLFIVLCIVDLLTGCLTVPVQIIMIILGSSANCMLVGMQAFFNCFTPGVSIWLLFMISIARFNIIHQSHCKYKNWLKPKNMKKLLLAEIMCSLFFSVLYVIISQSLNKILHALFLLVVSLFCIFLIFSSFVINIKLLLYIRNESKNSKLLIISRKNNVRQYNEHVTRTLVILSLSLLILYLPFIVAFATIGIMLLLQTSHDSLLYYTYFVPWTHAIIVLNSFVNSLVYMSRSNEIKKYYWEKLFGIKEKVRDSVGSGAETSELKNNSTLITKL